MSSSTTRMTAGRAAYRAQTARHNARHARRASFNGADGPAPTMRRLILRLGAAFTAGAAIHEERSERAKRSAATRKARATVGA